MKALLSKSEDGGEAPSFISHKGNAIKLGTSKSTRSIPVFEYQRSEFLTHHEGPHPVPASEGSFGCKRSIYSPSKRPQSCMSNPRADENSAYREIVESRKEKSQLQRTQDMIDRSHRTGYNVITGDIYGKGPKVARLHSRHIPDGLGPESHNRGIQQLRDSCNRFFTPQERYILLNAILAV